MILMIIVIDSYIIIKNKDNDNDYENNMVILLIQAQSY